jgi:hypothetical protein
LRVAEYVDQPGDRGKGGHNETGADEPDRRRRPGRIGGLPKGDVAEEGISSVTTCGTLGLVVLEFNTWVFVFVITHAVLLLVLGALVLWDVLRR